MTLKLGRRSSDLRGGITNWSLTSLCGENIAEMSRDINSVVQSAAATRRPRPIRVKLVFSRRFSSVNSLTCCIFVLPSRLTKNNIM